MAAASPIVSSIPGRLRMRHPTLRAVRPSADLVEALRRVDGVQSVEANVRTGSILLRYDRASCTQAGIEAKVAAAFPLDETPAANIPPLRRDRRRGMLRVANRIAKLGMLASFPLSLALAAAGSKKLHALSGGVFTLLLLVHLIAHRRHLMR